MAVGGMLATRESRRRNVEQVSTSDGKGSSFPRNHRKREVEEVRRLWDMWALRLAAKFSPEVTGSRDDRDAGELAVGTGEWEVPGRLKGVHESLPRNDRSAVKGICLD